MKTIITFLFPMLILAKTKGIVRDETTGKPIPYVNIWVEQPPVAVSSDEAGNFPIATKENDIINFSPRNTITIIKTGKDAPPFDDRPVEFAMELNVTN